MVDFDHGIEFPLASTCAGGGASSCGDLPAFAGAAAGQHLTAAAKEPIAELELLLHWMASRPTARFN